MANAHPEERSRQLSGVTERIRTGHGNAYITINFHPTTGKPFEVFVTLGKAGGCDHAQLEAVARLASLALRSGIDVQEVMDNLRGITCCPAWDGQDLVRSTPDAVAIALGRHLSHEDQVQPESSQKSLQLRFPGHEDMPDFYYRMCPDCESLVGVREGIALCKSCGWNNCQ
jgi:ribonucleoside-diphosphate reductase alpha chain